jgi:DNA-binding beta-propeller fold protein YncE
VRFDTLTRHRIGQPIPIDPHTTGLTVAYGSVWVPSNARDTVSRYDTKSGARIGIPIPVGRGPLDVKAGSGRVWVLNADDKNIAQIDPSTGEVVAKTRLSQQPKSFAVGDGLIWVLGDGDPGDQVVTGLKVH